MEAGNLRPVAVVTTEVEHRGRAPTRVVIDEAWGQVVEWGETMHGEGTALGTGTWSPGRPRSQWAWEGGLLGVAGGGDMEYEGRKELMGCREEEEVVVAAMLRWEHEAKEMEKGGGKPMLQVYPDAGFFDRGPEATGGYGWLITGLEDSGFVKGRRGAFLSGGGKVHGQRNLLSSTRCEAVGVLSALTMLAQRGWKYGVRHRLDNRGVVSRLHSGSDDAVRDPVAYLMMNDPDLTAQTEAVTASMQGTVVVGWHRGHPERRKSNRGEWTEHEHAIYRVDQIAGEYAGEGEGIELGWWDFPAKPTYSVWWRGELLQGQLRKRLLGCTRVERLKGYLVQMLARKKMVEEEKRIEDGGPPRQGSKAARMREFEEEVRLDLEETGEWWLPGLFRETLKGMGGMYSISDTVIKVKIMAGMLATQGSHAHRGREGENSACRCCGKEEGGGETNYHVLWECPGKKEGGAVVKARKTMSRKLIAMVKDLELGEDEHVAVAGMFFLKGYAPMFESLAEMAVMMGGRGMPQELVDLMEQSGVGPGAGTSEEACGIKLARRGLVGGGWVRMMVQMGIAEGKAVRTVAKLSNTTLVGGVSVWRAFNAEVRSGRAAGEEEAAGEGRGARSVVEEIIIQVVDMPSDMKARIRALGRAQRVRLHDSFWSRVHDSSGQEPDRDKYRKAVDEALWEATAKKATKGHKVITVKEFKAKKATEMAAAAAVQRRAGEGAMMGGEDRASTPVPLTHLEYMMNVGRVRDVARREAEEADRKVARREARGAGGGGKRRKGARVREASPDLMGDGGGARAGRARVRRRLVRCGSDTDTSDEDLRG